MNADHRALKLGAAALSVAFCALFSASASAQMTAEEGMALVDGTWGGVTTVEAVTGAACFNEAADVGGARASERNNVYQRTGGKRWIAFEQDCGIRNRGRVNRPLYKPEYWEWIRLLDYNANVGAEWEAYADPVWLNLPEGVPRMGPPDRIIYDPETERGPELTFLWVDRNTFKVIAADCREHDETLAYDQGILGHAVGCWKDGALEVHSRGFGDQTWLHWAGWPHSNEMEVIEKFTPQADGAELLYEVTVIDPVMFLEPWQMDPIVLERNTNPEAVLIEDVPYIEHSLGVMALPRNRG